MGVRTEQEVVQVLANSTTCWLPTGELIDMLAFNGRNAGEDGLKAG